MTHFDNTDFSRLIESRGWPADPAFSLTDPGTILPADENGRVVLSDDDPANFTDPEGERLPDNVLPLRSGRRQEIPVTLEDFEVVSVDSYNSNPSSLASRLCTAASKLLQRLIARIGE